MSDHPPTADDAESAVRPFADFLRETNRGRTHDELSTALHDLVAAVVDTGKGGALTLTVKVGRLSATDDHQLTVVEDVRLKLPTAEPRKSVFFADAAGNLSRSDPRQLAFESLRSVDDPPAPKEARTR